MASGHPQKRPLDCSPVDDSTASQDATIGDRPNKAVRTVQGDFSSVVKNRLQSYTRTGQACDRCKVRKIRCDALPEGCSHCINLKLDCFVTDRVTGRTERRGYMQQLEREKNNMLLRIRNLEELLATKGVQVKPWSGPDWAQYPNEAEDESNQDTSGAAWDTFGTLRVKVKEQPVPMSPPHSKAPFRLRSFLNPRRGDHLGLATQDSEPLSSIRGSRLTILGATIDTTSVEGPDIDEPAPPAQGSSNQPIYNKSVQAFRLTCLKEQPPPEVKLPSRADAFTYVEWYFLTVARYLPVLHKPTFMRILARLYDEPDFRATTAELCMIHTVFAIIYFEYGIRNWVNVAHRNHLNSLSNKHYHFAVSKLYELMSSQTLAGIQALALLACHTRAFPKPGCGTQVTSLALSKALDLGLNRKWKKPGEGTNLENELRKRAWWVVIAIGVALNGRRGRPMPITVDEFDTDFPDLIHDDLLTEEGVDTSRTLECPYAVGVMTMKLVPIWIEMYTNIYAVRRDEENYSNIVAALDEAILEWESALPDPLNLEKLDCHHPNHSAALYLRARMLEGRLCIYHPSVAPTNDKSLLEKHTRICEDLGRKMLDCSKALQKYNGLDSTWYNLALYLASAFSMLVASWERRHALTPGELASLRREMRDWMGIVNDCGNLLGTGSSFGKEVSKILNRTLSWIQHDMSDKPNQERPKLRNIAPGSPRADLAVPKGTTDTQATASASNHDSTPQLLMPSFVTQSPSVSHNTNEAQGIKTYHPNANMNGQTPYSTLSYEDHAPSNVQPPYNANPPNLFYESPQVAAGAAATPVDLAPGNDDPGSGQHGHMPAFATDPAQDTHPNMLWHSRGNTWQDWAAAMADSQDHYSANALLDLGHSGISGNQSHASGMTPDAQPGNLGLGDMTGVAPASWPLILFDNVTHGS